MFVTMYDFSKRENSTKRPTEDDITISGDVCFKNTTSLLTPTIIWAVGHEDNVEGDDGRTDDAKAMVTNYCEMNGKYYYVTDVRRVSRNHIEFDCRMDLLATYKNEILNTTAYVEYSNVGSLDIADSRIENSSNVIVNTNYESMTDIFSTSLGFVIEVVNSKGDSFDTPYYLTATEVKFLAEDLMSTTFWDTMIQYFENPLENVIKLQMTPISLPNLDDWGSYEEITVGNYNLESKGRRFSTRKIIKKFYEINIPWNYEDFRNRAPYSNITMYLPFVGLINIDTATVYKTKSLSVDFYAEVITGNVIYMVYADDSTGDRAILVGTYTGNCNTPVPIARVQSVNGVQASISSAIAGTSLAIGNPVGAVVGIAGSIDSFKQQTQINGSHSSALDSQLDLNITINVWSTITSMEPNDITDIMGLPTYNIIRLSNLSGYCKTNNVSVDCSATLEQKQEINSYLNGGVYLE